MRTLRRLTTWTFFLSTARWVFGLVVLEVFERSALGTQDGPYSKPMHFLEAVVPPLAIVLVVIVRGVSSLGLLAK